MAKTKVTSGMWRIDPKKKSRVIDRFGRIVATAEAQVDPSLIATAPDMFELLEKLENDEESIPESIREEIQMVLRKARGDFGLAVFSKSIPSQRRNGNKEWLKFIEGLWEPPFEAEK
jgi:hypothetical protein